MTKKPVQLLLALCLSLAVLVSIGLGASPAAHAAPPKGPGCGGCIPGETITISNKHTIGTSIDNVIVLDLAPGTGGSIARSIGWDNSFSASLSNGKSLGADVVSGSLGFSVSASGSDTVTCSADNSTNHDITLEFQDVYTNWAYTMTDKANGAVLATGTGHAQQFTNHRCGRLG